MLNEEEKNRVEYCKKYNIHHLFELLATKVLVERPDNPFQYLRNLLSSVEESEKRKGTYDATHIQFAERSPPRSRAEDAGAASSHSSASAGQHTAPLAAVHRNEADAASLASAEAAAADAKAKNSSCKITLGIFGLDNAGKTTLISTLEGETNTETTPTIGFTPVHFQTDDHDICMFDLGGAANFRGIWVHYFHDCHGIIFVIDSAAEPSLCERALEVLRETVQHPYMKGKPLLVLANKKDLASSHGEGVVPRGYLENVLDIGTPHRIAETSAIDENDANIESSLAWLIDTIVVDYDHLTARVKADTAHVSAENARKRAARLAELRGD